MRKAAGVVAILCLFVLRAAPQPSPPTYQSSQAGSALASDQFWDDRFAPPGLGGAATAIAISGGDVYVGGLFSIAGNAQASNIAKWNGSSWSALGSGTDDLVRALAVSAGDLYAGGDFTGVGDGIAANHIAKWDGNNWSALGPGLGDPAQRESVYAIVVSGTTVYAAGGSAPFGAGFVAKWDGATWSTIGTPPAAVSAMAVVGGDIYISAQVAGAFFKWTGTNWALVGGGLSGTAAAGFISAMAVAGTDIYTLQAPFTRLATWLQLMLPSGTAATGPP